MYEALVLKRLGFRVKVGCQKAAPCLKSIGICLLCVHCLCTSCGLVR